MRYPSAFEGSGETACTPLVETIGAPLPAILLRKDVGIVSRAPTRQSPFGKIGGKRRKDPHASTLSCLRCRDDQRPLSYVPPSQPSRFLRPQPGIAQHGYQ